MKNFNDNVKKLQSVFSVIVLLGVFALMLIESRPTVSMLLLVIIMILAFVNMLWLQQFSNNKKDSVERKSQQEKSNRLTK
ncbi:MAG: DUF4149 domain-containing protein [Lactobacillus sp.]|nr:DUF4149 domain-containing protein [Lactobacillus sp.]MBD5069246.1 DUF4149 domain-containing protein [Lactobacillus sp.]